MPKSGEKGATADREEPTLEPETKESETGANENEKESCVLHGEPPGQKASPSGKSAPLKIRSCSGNEL